MHDITVTNRESVYTGTMDLAIEMGKVTGKMVVTAPTAITGNVAGTSKDGDMNLEFPFHMVEQNCDGTVKMSIKLPEKPGPSTGTMEAVGCGGDKTGGTVELKPSAAKPAGRGGEAPGLQ
jgi:outer membrane lipoprotein SlyB